MVFVVFVAKRAAIGILDASQATLRVVLVAHQTLLDRVAGFQKYGTGDVRARVLEGHAFAGVDLHGGQDALFVMQAHRGPPIVFVEQRAWSGGGFSLEAKVPAGRVPRRGHAVVVKTNAYDFVAVAHKPLAVLGQEGEFDVVALAIDERDAVEVEAELDVKGEAETVSGAAIDLVATVVVVAGPRDGDVLALRARAMPAFQCSQAPLTSPILCLQKPICS